MAHMIDMTNARANIAVTGEAPWHGLGANLPAGQPIEVWAKAAGLEHEVRRAAVEFGYTDAEGAAHRSMWADRQVLYRSDTSSPLAVVSADYKIVQPSTVLGFFDRLCRHNGFTMETAGSLDGGRRVWALARVGDGAPVIGHDVVRPYVLLATSYDGSMSTTAKMTSVRVVCHNTLSYSVGSHGSSGERDTDRSCIRVPHSVDFNEDEVRLDLGIALTGFDRFLIEARLMAKRAVNDKFATEFLRQLLPPPVRTEVMKDGTKVVKPAPIEESRAYKSIMALFRGEAMGSGMPEANGTAWGLVNAVTQHVDWTRGRSTETRMNSAWFGNGAGLKDKARDLMLEVIA